MNGVNRVEGGGGVRPQSEPSTPKTTGEESRTRSFDDALKRAQEDASDRRDERESGGRKKESGVGPAFGMAPGGKAEGVGAKAPGKVEGVSPQLMDKIVESVRVGQNREGAMEVQMDLKATVFEGMSLKVSSTKAGVVAVMEVEQFAAKSALEARTSELVSRLQEKGIDVAEVRVEFKEPPQTGGDAPGSGAEGDAESGELEGEGWASGPEGPAGRRPTGPEAPRKPDSSTDYTV